MNVTVDLQVLQNVLFQKGHNTLGLLCMSSQLDPSKRAMPSEPVTYGETERNSEGLEPFFIQNTKNQ
jgi:hypothetical protein